jgi:hypothetical protein
MGARLKCRTIRRIPYELADLLLVCILLSGCTRTLKALGLAKQATVQLHSEFNAQRYQAIYQSGDAGLRQSASESDFIKFLDGVRQELGTIKQPILQSETFSFGPGQLATITLIYDTNFERGSGREKLIWKIDGDNVALNRYTIDSKRLQ